MTRRKTLEALTSLAAISLLLTACGSSTSSGDHLSLVTVSRSVTV